MGDDGELEQKEDASIFYRRFNREEIAGLRGAKLRVGFCLECASGVAERK